MGILLALLLIASTGWAQRSTAKGRASRDAPLPEEVFAMRSLSVVLGRPTDRSVTLNLLGNRDQEAYVELGTVAGTYDRRTPSMRLAADAPAEVILEGLLADREYSAGGPPSVDPRSARLQPTARLPSRGRTK
jgi:hypothetical protein